MKQNAIFISIFAVLLLSCFAISVVISMASSDGSDDEPETEVVDAVEPEVFGYFHCNVEIRDDLHRLDAFFGPVETYPAVGEASWPVVHTESHTAETLGYSLIQVRGISVPTQFPDRSRPLIFAERERNRFDEGMTYLWSLLSQSETLILRNPEATKDGTILCDVEVRIGGHDLDLASMLINDGHARPSGAWDWGARDVYEKLEE